MNITKVTIHITSKTGKRIYARRERAKKGIITILLFIVIKLYHKDHMIIFFILDFKVS